MKLQRINEFVLLRIIAFVRWHSKTLHPNYKLFSEENQVFFKFIFSVYWSICIFAERKKTSHSRKRRRGYTMLISFSWWLPQSQQLQVKELPEEQETETLLCLSPTANMHRSLRQAYVIVCITSLSLLSDFVKIRKLKTKFTQLWHKKLLCNHVWCDFMQHKVKHNLTVK